MHLSKKIASVLAVSALGISTLIAAPAASAANTSPAALYYPSTVGCGTMGASLYSGASGTGTGYPNFSLITGTVGDTIRLYNECATTIFVNPGGGTTPLTLSIAQGNDLLITLSGTPGSNLTILNGNNTSTSAQLVSLQTSGTSPNPSPAPDPSQDGNSSQPQTFELSITPTDGTTCANSSESGRAGTWMTLPAANDCSAPESTPNAALLGWATIPNFPVDIAQRQVDNGWGAYEMFNEDGQLTAVFIPAGMPTFLSAPGKIYPIWKM